MSLIGGSALLVEDLNVTMQVRTFTVPRITTPKAIDRLARTLRDRNIRFLLEHTPLPPGCERFPTWYSRIKITVGHRVIHFTYGDDYVTRDILDHLRMKRYLKLGLAARMYKTRKVNY